MFMVIFSLALPRLFYIPDELQSILRGVDGIDVVGNEPHANMDLTVLPVNAGQPTTRTRLSLVESKVGIYNAYRGQAVYSATSVSANSEIG